MLAVASSSGSQAAGWAPVRVFPVPQYTRAFDGPRTDFRETVYWNPTVETSASGDADVAFVTSDAVTSFRASAEGFSAAGLAGGGQATNGNSGADGNGAAGDNPAATADNANGSTGAGDAAASTAKIGATPRASASANEQVQTFDRTGVSGVGLALIGAVARASRPHRFELKSTWRSRCVPSCSLPPPSA